MNRSLLTGFAFFFPFPEAVPAAARGFLSTRMTESPLRNILLMNRSLLTGFAFFFPFPVFGSSVHISLTPSKTMLQCRSKAFTLPNSFLLFLQLIKTWVLFLRVGEDPEGTGGELLLFLRLTLFGGHVRLAGHPDLRYYLSLKKCYQAV